MTPHKYQLVGGLVSDSLLCSERAPRVTLAMPVFNGADFIAETLESLLGQSFADFELIITDNASTDATRAICEAYAARDPRVRYHCNEENLGAAGNYNRGHALARGEFLKWCAHDDLLSADYLERAVAALDADPEAVMAFGRSQFIDEQGGLMERSPLGEPFGGDPRVTLAADSRDPIERLRKSLDVRISCGAIFGVFRKSAVDKTLLHRKYYQSDRPLLSELALLGPFLYVPEAVFFNREHAKRSMRTPSKAERAKWQNSKADGRAPVEDLHLTLQHFEFAWRHRREVGLHRTLPALTAWTLRPRQLKKVALDLVALVSPAARNALARFAERSRESGAEHSRAH